MSPPDESVSSSRRIVWGLSGPYDPRPLEEKLADLQEESRSANRTSQAPMQTMVFHRPIDYPSTGGGKTFALGAMMSRMGLRSPLPLGLSAPRFIVVPWIVAPLLPLRLWEMALVASDTTCRQIWTRSDRLRRVVLTSRKGSGKTTFVGQLWGKALRDLRDEARSRRGV